MYFADPLEIKAGFSEIKAKTPPPQPKTMNNDQS